MPESDENPIDPVTPPDEPVIDPGEDETGGGSTGGDGGDGGDGGNVIDPGEDETGDGVIDPGEDETPGNGEETP